MGCPTCKSITLFKGDTGATGTAATVAAGSVSTLSPGASATVVNAGSSSAATFNFGIPQGATGATGSAGAAGAQGNAGGYTLEWEYDSGTTNNPGTGEFRFNHATPASVAYLYINDTARSSVGAQAFLNTFVVDASTSTYGYVKVTKKTDSSVFWMGKVTGVSDLGAVHAITVTYVANSGSFTDADLINVSFTASGLNKATLYAKYYTALITQSGTSAPTNPPLIPTTVKADPNYLGDIVWSRTSAGIYVGTLAGAFTGGHTICTITQGTDGPVAAAFFQFSRTDNNTVTLKSFNASGTLTDTLLNQASIEIRKYA
jgi:hypothetical protein